MCEGVLYRIVISSHDMYSLTYTTLFRSEGDFGKGVRVARVALHLGQLGCPLGGVERRRWTGPQLIAGFQHPRLPTPIPGKRDRKSTRMNSSYSIIPYAVFCMKKKIKHTN